MNELAEQKLIDRWQADPELEWLAPSPGWQRYTAELHDRLLERWADRLPPGTLVLKTDLFEEARGEDHPVRRIAARGWRPMGLDLGTRIAAAARRRSALARGPGVLVSDVRRLPLADASIPAILCNSTLDHFHVAEDIDRALEELVRILSPGGELILTFDNPRNPVVWLRNALPRRATEALGITEYHVGPTLSLPAARRRLRALGLRVRESGTFMHSLRYRSLRRLRQLQQRRQDAAEELGRMYRAERRSRWPTAQLTGHYIFLMADKPARP